jgi:radical SAM protein with 4Fe4S-binding SPASM domain
MINTGAVERLHPTLPIFKIEHGKWRVLYTSGQIAVVEPVDANLIEQSWQNSRTLEPESLATQVAEWLITYAKQAVEQRETQLKAAFAPECLTIYLSNFCHLKCSYCYAAGTQERSPKAEGPIINETVVAAAAQLVAKNCATKALPFRLVLHGGGEPTLHWNLVERLVALTQQIANQFKLNWIGQIATNGVLSEKRASFLAQQFDLIGLSCDGPPDIQDQQRPLVTGGKTSHIVERTARVISEVGGKFDVRATITPQTITRQTEIVSYLHTQLGATNMRFEPAYHLAKKNQTEFEPSQAAVFVEHFLAAQEKAKELGCNLSFSGVRLDEIHGPYCDVLRDVLHLTPDGAAVACFFCVGDEETGSSQYQIGNLKNKDFILYANQITSHRQMASKIPEHCKNCFNHLHCVRGCPENCQVVDTKNTAESLFRCQVQQQLALIKIRQAADQILSGAENSTVITDKYKYPKLVVNQTSEVSKTSLVSYQELMEDLPSTVDVDEIKRQWQAIKKRYSIENREMPPPIWAKRGFEDGSHEAWHRVTEIASQTASNAPISIYIHIPFCVKRCGFCDCYSIPLASKHETNKQAQYAQVLKTEMRAWSKIAPLDKRPVTTVHFGGGSPNCLPPSLFEEIVNECKSCFNIKPNTEWAIESTSSLSSEIHLTELSRLGFTRLHVGVQTLEEPLRKQIGRTESTALILARLENAIAQGFVTSVDILYGLPEQTSKGILNTLERLVNVGVHGISLYRLNISQRNNRFFENIVGFEQNAMRDYILFQVAEQFLKNHKYQKNHFTHFALPEDKNLYFRHTQRKEDLLSFGATADGVFQHYHYRHPVYSKYLQGIILEGGIAESALERKCDTVISVLMLGSINKKAILELNVENLFNEWLDCLLLKKYTNTEDYTLTANGSWLVNQMICDLQSHRVF